MGLVCRMCCGTVGLIATVTIAILPLHKLYPSRFDVWCRSLKDTDLLVATEIIMPPLDVVMASGRVSYLKPDIDVKNK